MSAKREGGGGFGSMSPGQGGEREQQGEIIKVAAPPPESPANPSIVSIIDSAIKRGDIANLQNLLESLGPVERQLAEAGIKRLETPVGNLIRASLKRSKSWAGELADKSLAEIIQLSRGSGKLAEKASKMLKLVKEEERLMEKTF